MKKILISIIAVGFFCFGCRQSGDNKNVEQIQDQVMVVHDEVMPRSGELMDLKEKISRQIDSLSKITPVSTSAQTRQEEGVTINKTLSEADSLMSDWMYRYNADTLKGMDKTRAKAYLELELKKITAVKEKINGGIEQAKKFLGN